MNSSVKKNFDEAMSLCNNGKFDKAICLLDKCIAEQPSECDFYRLKAQALMMLKRIDEAIDINMEALRIDPKNQWALVLMGNLFVKMGKPAIAIKYYEEVVEYNPQDAMAINNTAGALLEMGQLDRALAFFEKALSIDSTYVNIYYGLALTYFKKNEYQKSWDTILKANAESFERKENPGVINALHELEIVVAQKLVSHSKCYKIAEDLKKEVEEIGGIEIRLDENKEMYLSAKAESSWVHKRNYHLIITNPTKPFFEHLLTHELIHLRMMTLASIEGKNEILTSSFEQNNAFHKKYQSFWNKLYVALGNNKEKAEVSFRNFQNGLFLQIYNCPLDLFVEEYIFNHFPEMRPMQLLSLFEQEQINIQSVEKSSSEKIVDKDIIRLNKIMNMVSSMHLQDLYGLNFLNYYKPTKNELDIAQDLYEEYKAYRDDDVKPGEENNLVRYFVETFDYEDFCSVEDWGVVNGFSQKDIDEYKQNIPDSDTIENINNQFCKEHPDGEDSVETTMMSMYMLGALQRFDKMSDKMVAKIAMEIAIVGLNGINPNDKGYTIPSLPGEEFGGYQFLALYYVSMVQAYPEIHHKLKLPFDEAYYTALKMFDKKN